PHPPRKGEGEWADRTSGFVELAVQGLSNDLPGETAALKASRRPARVPTAGAAAHKAGAGHLLAPREVAQGLLCQRSGNAFGGELLRDQRRSARVGPPRHQRSREGQVVEVPELVESAQRLLDLAGRTATLEK